MSDRTAQLKTAAAKFRKTHKIYTLHLNADQDKEVIEWLEKQGNRSEAIRRLLKRHIAARKGGKA